MGRTLFYEMKLTDGHAKNAEVLFVFIMVFAHNAKHHINNEQYSLIKTYIVFCQEFCPGRTVRGALASRGGKRHITKNSRHLEKMNVVGARREFSGR